MKYKESIYNINVKLLHGKLLLYNSLSRALTVLEKEEITALSQVGETDVVQFQNAFPDNPVLKHLLGSGYILPENVDEKEIVRTGYVNARTDPKGVNFIICSTLACNFGCDYCFQGLDKPLTPMSDEIQDKAIALYEKLIAAKPEIEQVQMVWYGGEPLMKPKVIYKMADRLIDISASANIRYSASMVSNGFMLTKKVATELFLRGLKNVQITLDGSEEYHDQRRHLLNKKGTYWKIMENLQEWIDEIPIMVSIRVNIDERNRDGITHLIDDLEKRGLAGRRNFKMYFSPVESNTTACHNVSELTVKKTDYGKLEASLYRYAYEKGLVDLPYPPKYLGICSALRTNDYIIVPNGDVHKCWDTVSFPEKRVGTVYDTDALFARKNTHYQLWDSFDPFKNEICSSCKILPNCTSYCAHKFVYAQDSAGDSILPCPSLKYSLYERLVLKAEKDGFITADDYDPADIATDPYELTPKMHTVNSMLKDFAPAG